MGLKVYRIHEVWVHRVQLKDGVPHAYFCEGYKPALVAENHCFRTLGTLGTLDENGVLIDWVTVHLDPPQGFKMSRAQHHFYAQALLKHGVWVNGRHYVRCIRSAAGMRTGSALFVRSDVEYNGRRLTRDEVRDLISCGAQVATPNLQKDGSLLNPALPPEALVCNISKAESRFGLAKSTTYPTGLLLKRDISYMIVDDPEVNIEVWLYEQGRTTMPFKPADGMGTMRPLLAVRVVRQLQKLRQVSISPDEVLDYLEQSLLEKGYVRSVREDAEFKHLWLCYMPAAFQVRAAGLKGISVVYPHDELHGVDVDLVITKSQWKYQYDESRFMPEFLVCAWQKRPKELVKLNYQFLNALCLPREVLLGMAKHALDITLERVLTDPDAAKAFLGIVSTGDDEVEREEVSTIARVLAANEMMLGDYYVQRKLTDLFEKHVKEIGRGRIPVRGAYRYSIVDPGVIFGQPMLQRGQNYINNQVGTFAVFRSPLIHRSEAAKIRTVQVPLWEELALFRDLFVQSPWEDTDLRAGGADKDGDKFLVTDDPILVKGIDTNVPIFINVSEEGIVEEWNWKNITKMDIATLGGNAIGRITNLASSLVDWANAEIERLYQLGFDPEVDEYQPTPNVPLKQLLQDKGTNDNECVF